MTEATTEATTEAMTEATTEATKSTVSLIREILAEEPDLCVEEVEDKLREYGRSAHNSVIYRVKKEIRNKSKGNLVNPEANGKDEPNILERERISKRELICRYLAMDDKKKPCDIRRLILTDHGIDIGTGGDVYTTCKTYFKQKGKVVPVYGTNQYTKNKSKSVEVSKAVSGSLNIVSLEDFFEAVVSVGGKDVARKLLDIFG